MASDFTGLPENLPRTQDDGGADRLEGLSVPLFPLASTAGGEVEIGALGGWSVIYAFPRIGRPGSRLPTGWDEFPGARGCTPQSCGFRDNYRRFEELGVRVLGLSSSELEYQREARERLELPFDLVADPQLEAARRLGLPTFELEGETFYKRLTLILEDGIARKVFYPVFPPQLNANEVLAWLEGERAQ